MARAVWSERFSVGVPELDEQHRTIHRLLSRLLDLADAKIDIEVDAEVVSDTLTELTRYTQEHFQLEESLMSEAGFPELEEHQAYHEQFIEQVAELSMATWTGQPQTPAELLLLLERWLQDHILQVDMRYREHLSRSETAPSSITP